MNAPEQVAAGGGDGQFVPARADLLHRGQGSGVTDAVAGEAHGQVVAAVLALDANLVRDPPDSRVIKTECFYDGLQHVDEVIVPPDVSQLVPQQRFKLFRAQARQGAGWHEDHRPQPADDGRDLNQCGLHKPYQPMDSQSCGQLVQGGQE